MPVMDAATVWVAVGALGAVAAADIAAWAARQSRDAAQQANSAAETPTAIERGRRHDELAPEFELKFTGTGGDSAKLHATLADGALESLDEVTFHDPGRSRQGPLGPGAAGQAHPTQRAFLPGHRTSGSRYDGSLPGLVRTRAGSMASYVLVGTKRVGP
jgi:hypothetical protein